MEAFRVSVEPETGDRFATGTALVRPCFQLRHGKIQRPFLSDETLRRERLFDWLEARASRRLVYVTAEAGFGKTTLVADYVRHSRLRTFWYRLDEEDTDGLVFIRYLIAACQSVDTKLFARSAQLLGETSLETLSQDSILPTLLTEVDALGEIPSVLVLDDFHMVESVPTIGTIVERVINRAPDGLKVIVVSRRTPSLAVAAMRARGELAELCREELRFNEFETDLLFRDFYHHTLEPDVLHNLQLRTDGWAASLQLVKTAVDCRSTCQVRAFVDGLSGAGGDLYDYLAEEVLGDLKADLRDFLVRTAILEEIEPDTAAVAARVSHGQARRLLAEALRLGLISRGGDLRNMWRAHPLVREFLLAHLEAELGESGVAKMHRRLAAVMESRSWRLAARHWAAAGEADEVRRVICAATRIIIGTGDLATADEFITRFPDPDPNPWFDILRTRMHAAAGRYEEAAATQSRSESLGTHLAMAIPSFNLACALNRLYIGVQLNDPGMRADATRELATSDDRELASIAQAADLMGTTSASGSLDSLCAVLTAAADLSNQTGHRGHQGISLVNLSYAEIARGNHAAAISSAKVALDLLLSCGNSADIAAAHIAAARGLALAGRWTEALEHIDTAFGDTSHWVDPEVFAEAAEMHAMYGDPSTGREILNKHLGVHPEWADGPYWSQVSARLELELARPDRASELLLRVGSHSMCPGFTSAVRSLSLQIRASMPGSDDQLSADCREHLQFAEKQQAWFWWKHVRLTLALVSCREEFIAYVRSLDGTDTVYLSIQAELVARRLGDLDEQAFGVVRAEAARLPHRWRRATRKLLGEAGTRPGDLRRAVELLEIAGDHQDVGCLRVLGRRQQLRIPDAGRTLIRRLAPRVYVEDLGRVSIHIGNRTVVGTEIRKKVLSLLCFLLTRPKFTATREQVLEALWPEMDPEAGANSLNQSSYFLRQVLEPNCEDDASAGYLSSRSDLIWLDQELVNSSSADCLKLLGEIRRDQSPALVMRLAESYAGRFGVDFTYDDWASSFRDSLHASFLDRIERAVVADTKAGFFDRALSVTQLALQADPDAEQIELCLLRLYRRTGASAAAAGQYSHYASVLRDQLGIEPPPLESI
jgi:DNA-binding SARP family transcriptional activator